MANLQNKDKHFLKRIKGLILIFLSSILVSSVTFILLSYAEKSFFGALLFGSLAFSYLISGTIGVLYKKDKYVTFYPLLFILAQLVSVQFLAAFFQTTLFHHQSYLQPMFFFNSLFYCYLGFFLGFFTPAGSSSFKKLSVLYLKRAFALLFDFFLLFLICFIISFFLGNFFSPFIIPIIAFLFCFFYFTFSFYWRNQTLGMKLVKLKIEGENELKINWNQAVFRTLLLFPSIFLLSFVFSFISRTESMFHDWATHTYVGSNCMNGNP